MEIIGEDKRIRALYSETRFLDEQAAPSFVSQWHRAQSQSRQPRRGLHLAFASVAALVVALASLALWMTHSQPKATYNASANAAATNVVKQNMIKDADVDLKPSVAHARTTKSTARESIAIVHRRAIQQTNRKALQEAEELASWKSPTASLLTSSSDQLFKSLPQLNENANELKSFLPNRDNEKEK